MQTLPGRALIAVFLAALIAPAVDMQWRDASLRGPEQEGRATRPAPPWSADPRRILRYPERFEAYFNDTLGLRDHLLRLHSLRCLNLFETSPSSDVRVGKDGWLYYSGMSSFEVHRGLMPLSRAELVQWQDAFDARRDMAASIGAAYMVVIGPNKESIYPDYMPDGHEQLGPTRLDQLVDWLKTHSDVEFLDLRDELKAARSQDREADYLYFEEGTHWNGRGNMLAVMAIKRAATAHFPELADARSPQWRMLADNLPESWRKKMYLPLPKNRVRHNWTSDPGEQRAVPAPPPPGVLGMNYAVPDDRLPSLFVFHDSFGPAVASILCEYFSTTRARHDYLFSTRELIQDPPDLVVELFVERALVGCLPQTMIPEPRTAMVALKAGIKQRARERRFQNSSDVRLRLELGDPQSVWKTSGELQVRIVNDAEGTGLELLQSGPVDSLFLPPPAAGAASELLLLIEIDSSAACSADLYYQREHEDLWNAGQRVVLPLQAGRNRYWIPISSTLAIGQFRLRPGHAQGERSVLWRFEVRGVTRP